MSSLIANPCKKQICVLVSVKLFIVHTTFVPLFTLNWYNNNYNNNLLSSLLLAHNYSLFCSQSFCKHFTYSLDLHNRDLQTRNRNLSQGWLNYNWLSSAMSCLFIDQQDQSNERCWTGRFAYSASRELYGFPSCLLLLV